MFSQIFSIADRISTTWTDRWGAENTGAARRVQGTVANKKFGVFFSPWEVLGIVVLKCG